ncbi:hypothetical protein E2C01_093075 [Portunus trituberculatus]|uniref:Uncharacterized protein n=1 Tax=Portunus trituberculatus TaxID=210409 RepID=A0A5B7JTX6_PORTR|nr:hypothetical protein [Portunus trituberculatus]
MEDGKWKGGRRGGERDGETGEEMEAKMVGGDKGSEVEGNGRKVVEKRVRERRLLSTQPTTVPLPPLPPLPASLSSPPPHPPFTSAFHLLTFLASTIPPSPPPYPTTTTTTTHDLVSAAPKYQLNYHEGPESINGGEGGKGMG